MGVADTALMFPVLKTISYLLERFKNTNQNYKLFFLRKHIASQFCVCLCVVCVNAPRGEERPPDRCKNELF